ncbi:MAG: prolyl oligopeptidase family serine peptidase [Bacteroidota bacterium]
MRFYFYVGLTAFWLLSSLSIYAQQSDLIPRSLFFNDEERKAYFQLDPAGNKVYYLKNKYQLNRTLYYFDSDAKTEVSISFEEPVHSFFPFRGDSILVQFQTDTGTQFGVYVLKMQKLQLIQPYPILRAKIFKTNPHTGEAVAVLLGQEGEKGIYRLNLSGHFEKIREAERFPMLYFDDELAIRAGFKINPEGGKDFYYLQDEQWINFRSFPWFEDMFINGVNHILSVSSDGRYIYFTDNLSTDITQLVALDTQTGTEEVLFNEAHADLLPTSLIFNEQNQPISFVSQFGHPIRYHLSKEMEEEVKPFQQQFKEWHVIGGHTSQDKWLIENLKGGINSYYLFNRSEKKLGFLFTDAPHLEDFIPNHRTSFQIASFDSLVLPIQVYLRADLDKDQNGIPDQPLPTILYVHGGPWIGWLNNSWMTTRHLQLLANRGYAVIHAEFRGATTYGKEFVNLGDLQWGADMTLDNKAIAEWAIANKIAIPEKVGIFGWSYGGYAVNAGLSFTPDTYACGISLFGISDLSSFLATDFAQHPTWKKRVADIQTPNGCQLAKDHSPIHSVDQISSPLMLSTGGKDQRVPFSQSDDFYEALDQANKKVLYLYFPDEVHDYRNPQTWITFWGYTEQFLQAHLGGLSQAFDPNAIDIQLQVHETVPDH